MQGYIFVKRTDYSSWERIVAYFASQSFSRWKTQYVVEYIMLQVLTVPRFSLSDLAAREVLLNEFSSFFSSSSLPLDRLTY